MIGEHVGRGEIVLGELRRFGLRANGSSRELFREVTGCFRGQINAEKG